MHKNDSGIISLPTFSRTPVLLPAIPIETSTPHLSTSQHAADAQPSPIGPFSPLQQLIRNSSKLRSKEPKYNRSQPDHPNLESVLRTRTRQGYKPRSLLPLPRFSYILYNNSSYPNHYLYMIPDPIGCDFFNEDDPSTLHD